MHRLRAFPPHLRASSPLPDTAQCVSLEETRLLLKTTTRLFKRIAHPFYATPNLFKIARHKANLAKHPMTVNRASNGNYKASSRQEKVSGELRKA